MACRAVAAEDQPLAWERRGFVPRFGDGNSWMEEGGRHLSSGYVGKCHCCGSTTRQRYSSYKEFASATGAQVRKDIEVNGRVMEMSLCPWCNDRKTDYRTQYYMGTWTPPPAAPAAPPAPPAPPGLAEGEDDAKPLDDEYTEKITQIHEQIKCLTQSLSEMKEADGVLADDVQNIKEALGETVATIAALSPKQDDHFRRIMEKLEDQDASEKDHVGQIMTHVTALFRKMQIRMERANTIQPSVNLEEFETVEREFGPAAPA